MTRKAVIIGAPVSIYAEDYLMGVQYDIENYMRFLKSPTGGAWEDSEILNLSGYSKQGIVQVIHSLYCDYLLFIFSGHGGHDSGGNTILAINKNETITLWNLINKRISKQLFIIDSCRKYIQNYNAPFIGDAVAQRLSFPSRLTKQGARQLFQRYLATCGNGVVFCHSCSPGQSSFDTDHGGKFSSTMLRILSQWGNTAGNSPILGIEGAFQGAKNQFAHGFLSWQNPQLNYTKGLNRFFPFAFRYPATPMPFS